MYASYNYYESGYLLGRDQSCQRMTFHSGKNQAERVLNQYTFSRLVSNFGLITDEVKDCTCELAELLYQADKSAQQAAEQGGVLQSYSNDGESGTFDVSQSTFTEEGKAKKTREIVYRYLGNTGLLYAGV